MEGWKLSEGEYCKENITEDEIWRIFNYIFSTKSVNRTSYKFGFIKSLLESVFSANDKGELKLSDIFERFSNIYWSLIVKYKLKQGDKGVNGGITSIEKIFSKCIDTYPFTESIEFFNLKHDIKTDINKKVFNNCKRYVIGAVYGDSKGIFYSFSIKNNYLKFNPRVYDFMKKYNSVLLKINHYEWIKFLEKVNPEENSYSIANKLDFAAKRSDLKVYKSILYKEFNSNRCFYCGKYVKDNKVHIDHFIPWSFIRNDKAWNLVVSCSKCNLSKSDKMANEFYLNRLKIRDLKLKEINNIIVKRDFHNYTQNILEGIYKAAIYNGYDYWNKNFIQSKEIESSEIIRR